MQTTCNSEEFVLFFNPGHGLKANLIFKQCNTQQLQASVNTSQFGLKVYRLLMLAFSNCGLFLFKVANYCKYQNGLIQQNVVCS